MNKVLVGLDNKRIIQCAVLLTCITAQDIADFETSGYEVELVDSPVTLGTVLAKADCKAELIKAGWVELADIVARAKAGIEALPDGEQGYWKGYWQSRIDLESRLAESRGERWKLVRQ